MATPVSALPPVAQEPPPGGGTPPAAPPNPQADRLARLEQELENQRRLTQNLQQRVSPPTQQPTGQQPTPEDLRRQFYADPVAASVAIARQAALEATQQHSAGHMDTLIAAAREQVRGTDPELFTQYENEIAAQVAQVDPQFRANINVWTNAFNIIKGRHIRDITDKLREQTPRAPAVHISPGGGPAAPSGAPGPAPKSEELSPEEKKMARRLGITESDYLEGKKDNAAQNDERVDPLGPSSWDKVVTFNSKEKRRAARAARK